MRTKNVCIIIIIIIIIIIVIIIIIIIINIHKCRSVVPGYGPGRSAAYENQA